MSILTRLPENQDGGDSDIYAKLPLDPRHLSIRLLTILPGYGEAVLQCRLRVARVNAWSSYEALSYTWGIPDQTTPIYVNDRIVHVTNNLEGALRALRLAKQQRCVWVDAVCINQNDPVEQPRQVLEMGQIFRNAHQVNIWLREGTKHTALALDVIKGRKRHPQRLNSEQTDWEQNLIQGMNDILLAAWWTRIWVVQELAVAVRDPVIMCGGSSVTWSTFISYLSKNI